MTTQSGTVDQTSYSGIPETRHHWLVWVVAVQLGVLFAPTLVWLWERWTLSVWHNGHGILIALVVAYLAWEEFDPTASEI